MKQIRLVTARLDDGFIEINGLSDDGEPSGFRLSMTDFILLRLQLEAQKDQPTKEPDPLKPQPIQVIDPDQLTVSPDPLSGDPILRFGVRNLGDLSFRIPKGAGATAMAQQLLPYLSPVAATPSQH